MRRKHLFIMNPPEKLNLKLDTSVRIAHSLDRCGHKTFSCFSEDISCHSDLKGPEALVRSMAFDAVAGSVVFGDLQSKYFLRDFDCIHMRKDPPFDLSYISCVWLLDRAPSKVINAPSALLRFNEKLLTLHYPKACKRGLVSAKVSLLEEFVRTSCDGKAIFKPLDQHGGKGIFTLEAKDARLAKKISAKIEGAPFLVQAFDPRIYAGEVRALCVAGKALAWCLKQPPEGSYLANTGAGASLLPFVPSFELQARVEFVATDLAKKGIYLAGMDIIGDEISEINVTSPRLLLPPQEDETPYFAQIASWISDHVKAFKAS